MATVSRRNLVKDPRFAVLPTVLETGTPSFSTTHVRPDRTKAVKVDFPTDASSYPADVPTTLADPTVVQTSCSGDDQVAPTLTRPANTSSVVYTQTGNVVAGGSTTVTATAQAGYILPASQTDWIIAGNRKTATWVVFWANPNCTVPDATVYPEDPLVLQPYCVGSTLIPPSISKPVNTMSIVYTQSGFVLPGGSTTVTATAQSGYVFPSSVPGWTATGSNKVLNFVVYWSNPNCEVLG